MPNAEKPRDGPSMYKIPRRKVKTSNGAPQVEVVLGVLAAQHFHVELEGPADTGPVSAQGGKDDRHKHVHEQQKG